MNPPGQQAPECVLHARLESQLTTIQQKQDARPCQKHEAEIKALKESNDEVKEENQRQWTAIGRLEKSVWYQRGAMAVAAAAGSVLGSALVSYLFKGA